MNCFTNTPSKLIFVTGASGYLGLNIINLLAKEPHRIRVNIRSLNDKKKIDIIQNAGKGIKYPIEFVEADLLNGNSWENALKGVDIVIHSASPYPIETPKDVENELIRPAVEGTLNVLKAAFNAKVKRVVLTSSTAAIYRFDLTNKTFTEADWAETSRIPYIQSKIQAEKAAWDFVAEKQKKNEKVFDLAVINPSVIFGPSLGGALNLGTSELMISRLFDPSVEKISQFYCGHCDVRDVALAHLRAAFLPEAVGHRHIIVNEKKWVSIKKAAEILTAEFSSKGYKINNNIEHSDDPNNYSDNSRMINVLKIKPTDFKKSVIDMANSLIAAGVIKKQIK